MKTMTYRIHILSLAFFLITINSFPRDRVNGNSLSFFFIQVSDPQFGFFEENKRHKKEIELYIKAVNKINQLKPDFVVITGDFVNQKDNKIQIKAFKSLTKKISKTVPVPVHLIPGNHDIGQDPKKDDMRNYKRNYGKDRFAFSHKGSLFIGINSSLIKANTPKKEGNQYKWLKKKLTDYKKYDHVILFSHHPFFIDNAKEPENYSNLSLGMREKYLLLLKEHNVKFVFAGHYHDNGYGKEETLEMVTTSAVGKPLGKATSGLRIIFVDSENISHKYYSLEDIPKEIEPKKTHE